MERLNELLNQYKLPIALSAVGLVLIIGGIFSSGLLEKPKAYSKASVAGSKSPALIKIDVSGAVNVPGVHDLPSGSRVEDAIKAANGFSSSASAEFISKQLNLSQRLSDGQKIYIPFVDESDGVVVMGAGAQSTRVGLNSGSMSDLDSLPGVGLATAQKIIQNRPFQSVDELLTKKVVSRVNFEKIKDLVDLR